MRFAERHRRLVNALVHHKPQLLQTSLALLLRAPKLLDFDNVSWLGSGPGCTPAGAVGRRHAAAIAPAACRGVRPLLACPS